MSFESYATNLVPGGTYWAEVFLRDVQGGTTSLVSVGLFGDADGASISSSVSANGRFIAFDSNSTNLVPGDTNGHSDVFVRDTLTGTTTRVSVGAGDAQANNASWRPAISATGRFEAFTSRATNLVRGDGNNAEDVFVHDRDTGTTTRVSVSSGAGQANGNSSEPSISADGRYVAFTSQANLVWKHPKSATVRWPSAFQSAYGSAATDLVWKQPKSATVRAPSPLQSA